MGRLEQLYHARQRRDLQTGGARGLTWDPGAGAHVCDFIERYCRHSKGEWAGQLLALQPHQRERITTLFGWKRRDGTRRFRIAYIEIARKNAKSTEAAALALYLTMADREPGAEVYASATKKDQAKIVHSVAEAMVRQSPELRRFLRTFRNNIHCPALGAKFEPLGADSDTLDGLNIHGNIVDETHAHKDRGLWDVLQTAQGARRQPLTIAITTAGVYDPTAIGWELHEYAIKVLEGAIVDDGFFAYIAAADPGDDFRLRTTWEKANPNLGVSVRPEYLEEAATRAAESASALNPFLRYHLNVWTEQVTRWIPLEKWTACDAAPEPLAPTRRAYGGLDLSTTTDIAAFTLALPATDGYVDLVCRFWVPEDRVTERERKHQRPSYREWIDAGYLRCTPGAVLDYEFIFREIVELAGQVKLVEIGYDPWNAEQLATQLANRLNPSKLDKGFQMVSMRQGMATLSEPCKELERLVLKRRIRIGPQPVMRWMVSNVTVRSDANANIAPDKLRSGGKIDGVVSAAMAVGRASLQVKRVSVYESRGPVIVDLGGRRG